MKWKEYKWRPKKTTFLFTCTHWSLCIDGITTLNKHVECRCSLHGMWDVSVFNLSIYSPLVSFHYLSVLYNSRKTKEHHWCTWNTLSGALWQQLAQETSSSQNRVEVWTSKLCWQASALEFAANVVIMSASNWSANAIIANASLPASPRPHAWNMKQLEGGHRRGNEAHFKQSKDAFSAFATNTILQRGVNGGVISHKRSNAMHFISVDH